MGAGVSKNESSEKVLDAYYDRVYRFLEPKKYRYKVLYGGRGSSKSHTIAACLLLIAQNTRVRVLCTREIQNSIRDSVWRLLRDKIQANGWDDRWEITNDEIRCVTTGSEFIFKGLRNNPSIKSTEGISYCWVEEAQLVSQESWNVLIPTIRGAGSEIWISFNPDVEETPVWQMFVAHHRDNALVEKVNWDGNPWFPEELREEKDYLYRVDPGMAANVWGGELRSNTNASIFKGKYAIEAFPDDLYQSAERLFFGADFGFANDPSALVRCFIIDKVLYIDYEAYGFGVEITELAKLFRTVPDVDKWTIKADCARPETISHLAKVDHLNIVAAPKWKESVREGIEFIRSFEKVIIHPRCIHTADEFRHYSWKTDRITGEILNVPEDKNNHCIAQGVLVATDRGNVPVESVTTDDKVLTRDGFKRVLASVLTGRNREVLEIATDSCVLTCTPDHRIYTVNRGFVEAQTLTNEDILLCVQKPLSGMAIGGIDTLTLKGAPTECISNGQSKAARPGCIVRYGSPLTEKSRRVFISITKTVTHLTTRLTISCVCPSKNTAKNTLWSGSNTRSNLSILRKFERKQKHGTPLQKVSNGTSNTQRSSILAWLTCLKKPVRIVAKCLSRKHTMRNSAQTLANQRGAEKKDSITSRSLVSGVERCSPQTNTQKCVFVAERVRRITEAGKSQKVFDLTVQDKPEFFAGGVLVHNCQDSLRYALSDYIQHKGQRIHPSNLRLLRR